HLVEPPPARCRDNLQIRCDPRRRTSDRRRGLARSPDRSRGPAPDRHPWRLRGLCPTAPGGGPRSGSGPDRRPHGTATRRRGRGLPGREGPRGRGPVHGPGDPETRGILPRTRRSERRERCRGVDLAPDLHPPRDAPPRTAASRPRDHHDRSPPGVQAPRSPGRHRDRRRRHDNQLHRDRALRRRVPPGPAARPELLLHPRVQRGDPVLRDAHGLRRRVRADRGRSPVDGLDALPEPSDHGRGLPRRESGDPRPDDLDDRGLPARPHSSRRGPPRILFVDDRGRGHRPLVLDRIPLHRVLHHRDRGPRHLPPDEVRRGSVRMTGVVEAAGISKWYGEVLGLNGFSASFGPGITGLVGPNGAGKSTLFKLLIGQLHSDQGTLRLLGENPWNNVPVKRRLGYCPEHNTLYGWLTGQQFVEALLRLDGMPRSRAEKAAEDALKLVGLSSAAQRPTRTYSRGMRQRAKLAQALAHLPGILILAEPLSGADPLARVQILRTISDFAKAGGHVLMSTHVLYEIERVTNNIVLINNGKAIAAGDIHSIRALIDEHPHAVRLETPQPRQLAQ